MIATRDSVSQIVSRGELHQEVARLKERVDHWTAAYEVDRRAEQTLESEIEGARPDLQSRGKTLQRLQKVRRVLPNVGFGATLVTFPCMALGASMASPVVLAVGLVAALTVGGSILGIEILKAKLPDKVDQYNAEVERFNRRSTELDGLREETRRTYKTLEAAQIQYAEKSALEREIVDETSKMADAVSGRRPDGFADIEDGRDEVLIGSIRLPKIAQDR